MNNKTITIDPQTHLATLTDHFCPFRNPIMIQNQITGEIGYQNMTCNSCCPHFTYEYVADVPIGKLHLNCGSEKTTESVKVIIQEKPLKTIIHE